MIVTRTPFRITLGGGGTDLPSFYQQHGGFVLAVTIDKYMFLNVNTPIVDDKIRVRYSKSEMVDHVDEVQHDLAREAMRHFGMTNGVEIVSIADIPAGTGLGSSSTYLVGLLNALHVLLQDQASPQRLAEEACHIELDQLKKQLSSGITNPRIDAWYGLAKQNGAIGGKISGAGGGGFLLLYCEEKKDQVREAMRAAGLRELNFRFDFEGSKIIFDAVSRDGRLAHIQRQGRRETAKAAAAGLNGYAVGNGDFSKRSSGTLHTAAD